MKYEEFKKRKTGIANGLLKAFRNEFENIGKGTFGRGQYQGIYWIRLDLTKEATENLKDEYKGATAVHIMPYCITTGDVIKAEKKYKNRVPFKEVKESGFVDYDPDTGNFHKKIKDSDEIRPQIVLVNNAIGGYGPGWGTVREADSSKYEKVVVNVLDEEKFEKDKENRLNAIKTHWYFPPIGEENEKYEKIQTQNDFEAMIKKLLNDVITAIEERKTTAVE
ncbi:MAG: hypothetical protein IJC09_00115 [Clostridia bacterium]|nr:hypothetical protein [Clostridia bacterium]